MANLLPAFNQTVGDAWQSGRLGVHAEHLYTETLRQVVTSAVPTAAGKAALPRILLTTPPTELHSLGLLALHARLRLRGADAINLGTEMPVAEVRAAVQGSAGGSGGSGGSFLQCVPGWPTGYGLPADFKTGLASRLRAMAGWPGLRGPVKRFAARLCGVCRYPKRSAGLATNGQCRPCIDLHDDYIGIKVIAACASGVRPRASFHHEFRIRLTSAVVE